MGITLFVRFISSYLFLVPWCIARAGVLHDRSLSSVARDESRMARDESRMARDESHMSRAESRMAGDYSRPDKSIHRGVRTHSHLYSYIYMTLCYS
jgi:hypothetical protein